MAAILPDHDMLLVVWWLLLGLFLTLYLVLDGINLGAAMLLPLVARDDLDRRVAIAAVAPLQAGGQVWLVLLAVAALAGFPLLHAVLFPVCYGLFTLLLVGLMLRPAGFVWRPRIDDPGWRTCCDAALFLGGLLPGLAVGMLVANMMLGVPFRLDPMAGPAETGGFADLVNPFALLAGVLTLCLLALQGGAYLSVKTEGAVARRARSWAVRAGLLALPLALAVGGWAAFGIEAHLLSGMDGPSMPPDATMLRQTGAWATRFAASPWLPAAPALAWGGVAAAAALLAAGHGRSALFCSSIALAGLVASAGIASFPFLLPSTSHPADSLTIWTAGAGRPALLFLLAVVAVLLPPVLLLTGWAGRVMRGPVTRAGIAAGRGEPD